MARLFRRTLLFAAGALAVTAAAVRVRSTSTPSPIAPDDNIFFAILAEGTRWEVRVSGGGCDGTWHVDVPPAFRDLAPADRMIAVDKIMRRIADGVQRAPSLPDATRLIAARTT